MSGLSQKKSTQTLIFDAVFTAKFTLDNSTSKVTLVLTGPSNKWSSIGIGTSSSTTSGDVFVYTTSVIDNPTNSNNPNQDWNTISNTISSGIRTVTLERSLTNSDLNDLQLAFDSTGSIDVVWSRSGAAIATSPNPNRGSTTANFSATLGSDDLSFDDETLVYPNPTSSELFIKTKSKLTKVNVYNQIGVLVKTINIKEVSNEVKIIVSDLPKALYIFELQNDFEKSWKKVIVH